MSRTVPDAPPLPRVPPRRIPARHPRLALAVAALFGLAVLAGGCEEAVNPFLDDGRYFTLYGYLDTDRDTQFVRVEPLRRTVDLPAPGPLTGVSVTMTEVETGKVVQWRDSLVAFSVGLDQTVYGHVFRTVFRPQFGRRYRISVKDAQGNETFATTHVPARRTTAIGTISTQAGFAGYELPVQFQRVERRPLTVDVWYRMQYQPGDPFIDYPITYTGGREGALKASAWQVTVELSRDADTLRKRLSIPRSSPLPTLYGVGVRIAERDSAFVPPATGSTPSRSSSRGRSRTSRTGSASSAASRARRPNGCCRTPSRRRSASTCRPGERRCSGTAKVKR